MKRHILITLFVLSTSPVFAQIDLVTLPPRDSIQLTIYNSADLTLALDGRALTLDSGLNRLQFSWANTLIDPTSLEMVPKAGAADVEIMDLVYPPRVKNVGIWNVESTHAGKVPVEIAYFTSGLSWRAFYMGTLTPDEKTMRLEAYVRVTNNSGEDYENASVRLIVGKVHLLDQIAQLAQQEPPYGRPGAILRSGIAGRDVSHGLMLGDEPVIGAAMLGKKLGAFEAKAVVKEGLSEYFLYTIEGTETIVSGSSKRLKSFEIDAVPVSGLYKFEQERYGNNVIRFLSFENDKEHKLGETPIPGGAIRVYRTADSGGHLSYTGQSAFKYIPVDEDVELNLGPVQDVVVEPVLKDYRTTEHRFNYRRDISGYDEIQTFDVTVKNTRELPVKVEIQRNFPSSPWTLEKGGQFDQYEQVDLDTVKFTLSLEPRSVRTFSYTVTIHQGDRGQEISAARAAQASARQPLTWSSILAGRF